MTRLHTPIPACSYSCGVREGSDPMELCPWPSLAGGWRVMVTQACVHQYECLLTCPPLQHTVIYWNSFKLAFSLSMCIEDCIFFFFFKSCYKSRLFQGLGTALHFWITLYLSQWRDLETGDLFWGKWIKTHCPLITWFGSWASENVAVSLVSDPFLHICEGRACYLKVGVSWDT